MPVFRLYANSNSTEKPGLKAVFCEFCCNNPNNYKIRLNKTVIMYLMVKNSPHTTRICISVVVY